MSSSILLYIYNRVNDNLLFHRYSFWTVVAMNSEKRVAGLNWPALSIHVVLVSCVCVKIHSLGRSILTVEFKLEKTAQNLCPIRRWSGAASNSCRRRDDFDLMGNFRSDFHSPNTTVAISFCFRFWFFDFVGWTWQINGLSLCLSRRILFSLIDFLYLVIIVRIDDDVGFCYLILIPICILIWQYRIAHRVAQRNHVENANVLRAHCEK